MNEKKTTIQKIKEFVKKYWRYIATFFAGIVSAVFLYFKSTDGLPKRSKSGTDELDRTLEELGDRIDDTGRQVSDTRDENRDALHEVGEQRQALDDIRDGHTELTDISSDIGKSIQRLQDLVEAERRRIEKDED